MPFSVCASRETRCTTAVSALTMENLKRKVAVDAALFIVSRLPKDSIIGVGSGSTIAFFIEEFALQVKKIGLNVKCVPTSFDTKLLLNRHQLPVVELADEVTLDVCVDGADEILLDSFVAIKGYGGALTQEKLVALSAKELVLLVDYSKVADSMCKKVFHFFKYFNFYKRLQNEFQ